ncbi:MAG: F0F1 ATP synthase subunit B [Acidimicrobiia bacterium]|jgi:F-type H+-transporting ATPase subunit b
MNFLFAMAVLAQEESSGSALILPEPAELVAGIIAFLVVFFFVWKWALPTINKTLDSRQQAISARMAEAETAKHEAEALLSDYKAQLADAKSEGNRIVEEARVSGDQMKSEIIAKANDEAGQLIAKARAEADSEKSRAMAEARREVGELSVDLAGKIVGESLDAAAHKGLVERYLADLEKL